MNKIPQILLRAYLRRNPVNARLNQFNFLRRYAWLKNVLEEIRPELFPQPETPQLEAVVDIVGEPSDDALQFIGTEIRGQRGTYLVKQWHEERGAGQVFVGMHLESGQTVALKELLLRSHIFNSEEALGRQEKFANLAMLRLADGRPSHFRIVSPLEAIADTKSVERCYLVTPDTDLNPTLRTYLQQNGAVEPRLARELVGQLLQTLHFLHRQRFVFANGQRQSGLVHGQLSPDTVLIAEIKGQTFAYLCDFVLWEQLFKPPTAPLKPVVEANKVGDPEAEPKLREAAAEAIQADLRAVAKLGFDLLSGMARGGGQGGIQGSIESAEIATEIETSDPDLVRFLGQLKDPDRGFINAEAAHEALLALPALYADELDPLPEGDSGGVKKKRSRLPLMLILSSLMLLAGLAWSQRSRFQPREQVATEVEASACCMAEVGAVPQGVFRYTAVEEGSWQYVVRQPHLLKRDQTMGEALAIAHPNLLLQYQPSSSIEDAINAVKQGNVDFAVVPLLEPLSLEVIARPIAYDGLAVIVPFSYAERRKGLPSALNGQISLSQIQEIYASWNTGAVTDWKQLGASRLPIGRFAPENPEAVEIFEQRVMKPIRFRELSQGVEQAPTLEMLRKLIRGFERSDRPRFGGIGFSTLSQIRGQCSVYPLAIQAGKGKAVQPLILRDGQAIDPETDLCDRKGNYHPDVAAFKTERYPLAYPIAVVYANDNRRIPIGRKFADLMQTQEGQALLSDAGLVPLEDSQRPNTQPNSGQQANSFP